MRRLSPSLSAGLTLVLVALPAAALAQTRTPRPAPAPPAPAAAPVAPASAWIGFIPGLVPAPGGGSPLIVVTAIADGSPAARAGLEPGDTLLAVGGVPLTDERFRGLQAGLRPGDRLELTIRRRGADRTVTVQAARRPARVSVPAPVAVRIQSARRAISQQMDSLRVVVQGAPVAVAPPLPPGVFEYRFETPGAPVAPTAPFVVHAGPGPETPFSVHVFRDDRTDSIARLLRGQERALVEARSEESRRLRELAARLPDGVRRVDLDDGVLRGLRARRQALTAEIGALRTTLERIAMERAGAWAARAEAERAWSPAPEAALMRPLTPYIAGRDRVAGARVTPLNAGLGGYFGASRGLLVVDVAPGTPAAEAGLAPGDVLLRVGTAEVADLDALRRAVVDARPDRALVLTVLRRGTRIEVALPR